MTADAVSPAGIDFGRHVRRMRAAGHLVVQPRMGFGRPEQMRAGLLATRRARAATVGTITLDSFTRVGDLDAVRRALRDGTGLNGYPIASHDAATTAAVLRDLHEPAFPVQVRHGSAVPQHIFTALAQVGITATEGGPVSYCLPYGQTPLAESVRNWEECVDLFVSLTTAARPHLETFGGCLMGQLCPPSLLVAVTVLEALFFCSRGVSSVSVSYAQQTSLDQDIEAVGALRRLCAEMLPTEDWHVVIYAYMGVYPTTPPGARRLLGEAVRVAAATGSERLIVKTVAESIRIPTIEENVEALETAEDWARTYGVADVPPPAPDSQIYAEAYALISAVLNLDSDVGRALVLAFQHGYLDVPYCLHPDNAGRARGYIDDTGRLRWAEIGAMPLRKLVRTVGGHRVTASGLLADLNYVRQKFDSEQPSLPARSRTSSATAITGGGTAL
ncbi:MAG: methylaspartate mutase [Hamadaea sp.]|uniref:methylaspartate mutase n=1 Tax=Hamadaea sp. TaxID=2024425 RepID=UPI001824C54D|nr:methylaspartate mutase [Hamadaea sp.]NUR69275.1 methylaspartate mutase [Hamadaea sp.]NUT22021.1 methylaspartate mutase [Hamadaea sp.]